MGGKSGRPHYAWKIMIACMCIKMGSAGALTVAMGNFVTPIVQDLNCEVSSLTMFVSIQAISMALMYTLASRILMSRKIGRVMGIASVAEVSGLALMATYHSPYMFYLSGLITGVAQAFTGYVAIPTVINMWFKKKAGTVLGMVIAVGSAAGIIYNMLSARLIVMFGWRSAYMILAAIAAVITIPAVFLIIKTPRELGLSPYGEEDRTGNAERQSRAGEAEISPGIQEVSLSPYIHVLPPCHFPPNCLIIGLYVLDTGISKPPSRSRRFLESTVLSIFPRFTRKLLWHLRNLSPSSCSSCSIVP